MQNKIGFEVFQMKFLVLHITHQKLSFDIFTVGNVQNIFMDHAGADLVIWGPKQISGTGPQHNNYMLFYALILLVSTLSLIIAITIIYYNYYPFTTEVT